MFSGMLPRTKSATVNANGGVPVIHSIFVTRLGRLKYLESYAPLTDILIA